MRLPDYTSLGQANPQPSTSIAEVPNAGAMGEAEQHFGAAMGQAGDNLQAVVDRANVMQAINSYSDQASKAASDHYALQGKAAYNDTEPFINKLGEIGNTLVGSMVTNTARQALQQHIASSLSYARYRAGMYGGEQLRVFAKDQQTAFDKNDAVTVQQNALADPAHVQSTIDQGAARTALYVQHDLGGSPEMAKAAEEDYRARMQAAQEKGILTHWNSMPLDQRQQIVNNQVQKSTPSNDNGPASTPVPLPKFQQALLAQESGNNPNAPTSVDGAVGAQQITPAAFQTYAKPGESIVNNTDRQAVFERMTAEMYQKYNGDPARMAVAYFSGPGNVAPAGSTTPWIRDVSDGNGKSVSSYVSDVTGRLGISPTPTGGYGVPQPPKINGVTIPPNLWDTMVKSTNADSAAALKAQEVNQKLANMGTQNDFMKRLYDPAISATNPLTAADISTSNLPPVGEGSKEAFYKLLAAGKTTINPNDPAVVRQIGILRNMQTEDPEGFAKVDMSAYAGKIPASDVMKFQEEQQKIISGDTSLEGQLKHDKDIITAVTPMIPPAWRGSKDATTIANAQAFRGNVITTVRAQEQLTGKPLDVDGIQKIASDMLNTQVSVPGSLWGENTVASKDIPAGTNPTEITVGAPTGKTIPVRVAGKTVSVPENMYVPLEFRTAFSAAYQRKYNALPTPAQIMGTYLTSLGGQ